MYIYFIPRESLVLFCYLIFFPIIVCTGQKRVKESQGGGSSSKKQKRSQKPTVINNKKKGKGSKFERSNILNVNIMPYTFLFYH